MTAGTRIIGSGGRGEPFTFTFDGEVITAHPGETIAAALIAAGKTRFRISRTGTPRGFYCGMGVCFECLVTVDAVPNRQACMTEARPGMVVETSIAPGHGP
jgi:predicted molibdopterin-dependent oxidoreductase YjgC